MVFKRFAKYHFANLAACLLHIEKRLNCYKIISNVYHFYIHGSKITYCVNLYSERSSEKKVPCQGSSMIVLSTNFRIYCFVWWCFFYDDVPKLFRFVVNIYLCKLKISYLCKTLFLKKQNKWDARIKYLTNKIKRTKKEEKYMYVYYKTSWKTVIMYKYII